MNYASLASNVTVLANCVRSDSSTFPWALRSAGPNGGSLTYVGENPLVYVSEGDRYLAFCDLLFDALAATTSVQHRALVRIEDIDPRYETNTLKSVADWLKSQNVPFGFQIIPYYLDPLNAKVCLQPKGGRTPSYTPRLARPSASRPDCRRRLALQAGSGN
jgi:uncharacterized protein YdaL